MKKSFMLFCMIACSSVLFAQLKVDSIGRVKIANQLVLGKYSNFWYNAGLQTSENVPKSGTYYGIYSSLESPSNYMILETDCSSAAIYGRINLPQLGMANSSTHEKTIIKIGKRFMSAVAGVAELGVGVYGATAKALPIDERIGTYAGYFAGNMKVTGTISATTVSTTSDRRLKENIQSVSSLSLTDGLRSLRPVAFNYKVDTTLFSYDEEAQEMRNTHYGLIAQEVQQIYPDIVYENQDGYLSINYTELIPLLIQSLQELTAKVESLENQLVDKTEIKQRRTHQPTNGSTDINAILYQNNPNPFTENTVIAYDLPTTTKSAALYIYDMNGVQLAQYDITSYGSSSLTIDGGSLSAGMYLYSLIADGIVVDTKRMILTQ